MFTTLMDFGGVSKVVVFEISGDERAAIPAENEIKNFQNQIDNLKGY